LASPNSQGRDPTLSPSSGAATPSLTCMPNQEGVDVDQKPTRGCLERIQIGPGRFFRPTKGLVALFSPRSRPRIPLN
jgi:hypothetical protein